MTDKPFDPSPLISPAAVDLLQANPPKVLRLIPTVAVALFAGLVLFSALHEVSIVVVAPGRIVPEGYAHPIQTWTGGILKELRVREGQKVLPGELLVRMESRESRNDRVLVERRETEQRQIQREKGQTEARGSKMEEQCQMHVDREKSILKQLELNRALFEEEMNPSQGEVLRDLQMQRKLLERGLAAANSVRELEAKLKQRSEELEQERLQLESDLKHIRERVLALRTTVHGERQEVDSRLALALERLREARFIVDAPQGRPSTEIQAPIGGIIVNLQIRRIGSYLKPGELLLAIAPSDLRRVAELKVPPAKIGDVKVGLPVRLKYAAFPYPSYGIAMGTVLKIAPDLDSTDPRSEAYKVIVELDQQGPPSPLDSQSLPLGMSLSGEIVTERRRAIGLLLKEFQELRQPLRETPQ